MLSHFNDLLLASPRDGASATIGISRSNDAAEVDDLMDAWYRERQDRIEAGLFLDQARRLLGRIISEGRITSADRKKARRLLLAIKEASDQSHREG